MYPLSPSLSLQVLSACRVQALFCAPCRGRNSADKSSTPTKLTHWGQQVTPQAMSAGDKSPKWEKTKRGEGQECIRAKCCLVSDKPPPAGLASFVRLVSDFTNVLPFSVSNELKAQRNIKTIWKQLLVL